MIIDRKQFLSALESVMPGTSAKESVEQSTCFIFTPGQITTFNDEVCCRQDTPLQITGAVPHKSLLELIRKLQEDEITVTATEKELRIKGEGKRAAVKMSPDVLLPTGVVEPAVTWKDVCPAFGDAISVVAECAAKDNPRFELNCVHFKPMLLEACDELQLVRYDVDTGTSGGFLIRKASCMAVHGLGVAQVSECDNWLHWKTYTGLHVSVRKYTKEYPDLSAVADMPPRGVVHLPPKFMEALERATPLMANKATGKTGIVKLMEGSMIIRAISGDGWSEEIMPIEYSGQEISFGIHPKNASSLVKHGLPCEITDNSIRIKGDSFLYAMALENV